VQLALRLGPLQQLGVSGVTVKSRAVIAPHNLAMCAKVSCNVQLCGLAMPLSQLRTFLALGLTNKPHSLLVCLSICCVSPHAHASRAPQSAKSETCATLRSCHRRSYLVAAFAGNKEVLPRLEFVERIFARATSLAAIRRGNAKFRLLQVCSPFICRLAGKEAGRKVIRTA
jgi:hypothetical protein